MKGLPPIPVPGSIRWRELRCRWLPGLVFASLLLLLTSLWRESVLGLRLSVSNTATQTDSAVWHGHLPDARATNVEAVSRQIPPVRAAPLIAGAAPGQNAEPKGAQDWGRLKVDLTTNQVRHTGN